LEDFSVLGSFLSRSIGEHTLEKRQVKNILKRKKKKVKKQIV
jgi:hypothetical protein